MSFLFPARPRAKRFYDAPSHRTPRHWLTLPLQHEQRETMGKEIRSHRIIPSAPVDYLRDIDKVNYNTASSWPTYKVWCREFSSTLHEPRTMDRDGSIAAIKLLKSGKRRWKGSRKKYHCLAWANETFNVRCNKACDQKCFNRRKPLCLALF